MVSSHEEIVRREMRGVYSDKVIDHALKPRNLGDMKDASGFGRITGPCGDTMEIWLRVVGDVVAAAAFATDGCGATVACGSMLTEIARGRSVSQALRISQQDVLAALGGLPEGNEHCALLAVNALREIVESLQM